METVVNDIKLEELEEFSKAVMQSKTLHYDMYYMDFFLNKKEDFHYKELKKILETRQIKTVFNCLKKHGMSIKYVQFCEIVRNGNLKEKTERQKRQKKVAKVTQQDTKTTQPETVQKTQREKPKTLAEIQAETEAFFKASRAKPSAAVQKRLDRLNNNGEKNK